MEDIFHLLAGTSILCVGLYLGDYLYLGIRMYACDLPISLSIRYSHRGRHPTNCDCYCLCYFTVCIADADTNDAAIAIAESEFKEEARIRRAG